MRKMLFLIDLLLHTHTKKVESSDSTDNSGDKKGLDSLWACQGLGSFIPPYGGSAAQPAASSLPVKKTK